MNNQQRMERILSELENRFTSDMVYDYFSAFHDVVVLGHSSSRDDNPHEPSEQPCYSLYHTGAVAAEKLLSELQELGSDRVGS